MYIYVYHIYIYTHTHICFGRIQLEYFTKLTGQDTGTQGLAALSRSGSLNSALASALETHSWWLIVSLWYPLVNSPIAVENHHF